MLLRKGVMAGSKFRGLMRKVISRRGRRSGQSDRLSNINESLSNISEDRVEPVMETIADQCVEREASAHPYASENGVADIGGAREEQVFEAQAGFQERNDEMESRENEGGVEAENLAGKGKYIPVGGYDTPIDPLTRKRPLEWKGTQLSFA